MREETCEEDCGHEKDGICTRTGVLAEKLCEHFRHYTETDEEPSAASAGYEPEFGTPCPECKSRDTIIVQSHTGTQLRGGYFEEEVDVDEMKCNKCGTEFCY